MEEDEIEQFEKEAIKIVKKGKLRDLDNLLDKIVEEEKCK